MIILFHLCVQAFTIKFFFFFCDSYDRKNGESAKKKKKRNGFQGDGKAEVSKKLKSLFYR